MCKLNLTGPQRAAANSVQFGEWFNVKLSGGKWFNVKLSWEFGLTLNDLNLRAPRVSWTLGINLAKTFPAVGPMGGPICLILPLLLLPYTYNIVVPRVKVNLFFKKRILRNQ